MRKAFAAPAVHFKGSGWAKKDRGAAKTTRRPPSPGPPNEDPARTRDGAEGPPAPAARTGSSKSGSASVAGSSTASHRPGTTDVAGSAADWITLAEAVEVLEAANVHFKAATIGGWARSGKLQSIKLGGRRYVKRGQVRALVTAPRTVRADRLQPGLFEDWTG